MKALWEFLRAMAHDARIPKRDKLLASLLLLLVVSPVDLIPDWIPLLGQLDDLAYLALLADYATNHLAREIWLSHWPFSLKSFTTHLRFVQFLALPAPRSLRKKLWRYRPPVH